jgi:hypothetical protein
MHKLTERTDLETCQFTSEPDHLGYYLFQNPRCEDDLLFKRLETVEEFFF